MEPLIKIQPRADESAQEQNARMRGAPISEPKAQNYAKSRMRNDLMRAEYFLQRLGQWEQLITEIQRGFDKNDSLEDATRLFLKLAHVGLEQMKAQYPVRPAMFAALEKMRMDYRTQRKLWSLVATEVKKKEKKPIRHQSLLQLNDGHNLLRSVAWRLGIVRWFRQVNPDRILRIEAALAQARHLDPVDPTLFSAARPLLVLDRIDHLQIKLVEDFYAYDTRVAVLYVGVDPIQANPFIREGIPMVLDTKKHLRALLAIDKAPLVIERRAGGLTYTAATGHIHLAHLRSTIPAYIRTLAEIEFLRTCFRGEHFQTRLKHLNPKTLDRLYEDLLNLSITTQTLDVADDIKAQHRQHRRQIKTIRARLLQTLHDYDKKHRPSSQNLVRTSESLGE